MTTVEQTGSQVITITPVATKAIQDIIAEKNLEGYALRVYASGGGCCGAQFGMALDNNVQANDISITLENINILVDDLSMEYLQGASIDFVNHPEHGSGFVVNLPHSHQAGDACACGGSCACSN
jgi:iron-sulfur cluster insertion protein